MDRHPSQPSGFVWAVLACYLGFALALVALQELVLETGRAWLQVTLLVYTIVAVTGLGIGLPLILTRRYAVRLSWAQPAWRRRLGVLLLAGIAVAILVGSEAVARLLVRWPGRLDPIKYTWFYFPLALAISLIGYTLIPEVVRRIAPRLPAVTLISYLVGGGAVAALLVADRFVAAPDKTLYLVSFALAVALGAYLVRSLAWTTAAVSVVFYGMSLAEWRYFEFSGGVMLLGLIITVGYLIYHLTGHGARPAA